MSDQISSFWLDEQSEQPTSRRRETFLLSVILHLLGIILVITQPELFSKLQPQAQEVEPAPQEVTLLYEPSELKPPEPEPEPEPLVQPKLEQPEPPRVERPTPPALPARPRVEPPVPEPSGPGADEELLARGLPPIGIPEFPEPPKEDSGPKASFEPVEPPEPEPSEAKLRLPPQLSPGRGTENILKGLAEEHAAGGGRGLRGDYGQGAGDSDFTLPGPQILSDTMGVDFDPYLLRVYLVVRRNWYSVIPEIARLGRQGKVVLQFSILQNGSVPDLILTSGSGTPSMDTAALASIRLSNPFPPLPQEFPGEDIRLRFTYLYNLPWNY